MIEQSMTSAGLLLAAVTLGATALVCLVLRWIGAIPVAHAWNPDTHDKLTSYALELLQREQELLASKEESSGPTLLGWVLSHCGQDPHFQQHFVKQLRRGSVDEYMNSDLYTALRPLWNLLEWFAGHPYGEPAFKIMLRTFVDRDEKLEGTNGAYHFFNPNSGGLSDPVLVALLLRKLEGWVIEGTADVMPSAWQRASCRDVASRDWWHFDREKRNYTFQDADDYYAHGYSHLAAYAMGRVLHLLQDMAVPAHVRDDSHLGIGGDNTDPLERYAADTDWSSHFGTGDLDNVKVRWHFALARSWLPAKQPDLLQKAAPIYVSVRKDLQGKDYEAHFLKLAKETHLNHYSYGTIPGNADAHDPDNPKERVPWCPPGEADYKRCRVNVRALIELFDLTGVRVWSVLMEQAIRDEKSAGWRSEPAPGRPDDQPVLDAVGKLRDLAQTLGARADADLAAVQSSDLLSLIHAYEELYRALVVGMPAQLGSGEPLAFFMTDHQYLNLGLLKETLQKGESAEAAIKKWLAKSDRVQVAHAYQGIHGPYCIANHVEKAEKEQDLVILGPQYDDCEARAIAYTAACLVKWFEVRYVPDNGLGIAIWRNSDAPHSRADARLEPFDRSVDGRVSNDQQVPAAGRTLTLGIANHLLASVDLEVQIQAERLAENDQEILGDKVPLGGSLQWFEGVSHRTKELSAVLSLTGETCLPILRLEPYNVPVIDALPLPDAGGIRRESEEDTLVPVAANLGATGPTGLSGQAGRASQTRTDIAALVLRLDVGGSDDWMPPPASPPPPDGVPRDVFGTEMKK